LALLNSLSSALIKPENSEAKILGASVWKFGHFALASCKVPPELHPGPHLKYWSPKCPAILPKRLNHFFLVNSHSPLSFLILFPINSY
jgi:hypothetical protein